ncbi:BLUF domain protein [Oceaniovalibus guishaninsula JLT2003]|uniref:BLUF domain protein n=1 Tax=Oceaniovalibus guishaninsula JLT2003 TaxID=1231392 RepID=K2HTA6_9RHOB|nr:BLUF domain-containing protein [Oceaniovalibus guishaninsula]EKE45859.1 BLUF domain protein [Oceaniovalibus guishaninsula JLT2003]
MIDQIVYASTSSTGDFTPDLPDILRCARRNNPELGITGLLVVGGGTCLQLLEGEPEQLDALLSDLNTDPRHGHIVVMERRHAPSPALPGWAMGYSDAGPAESDLIAMAHDAMAGLPSDPGIIDRIVALARAVPDRAIA